MSTGPEPALPEIHRSSESPESAKPAVDGGSSGRRPRVLAAVVLAVAATFALGAAAGGASLPWTSAADIKTVDGSSTAPTTESSPATTEGEGPAEEPTTTVEEPLTSAPPEEPTTTAPPDSGGDPGASTAAERHGWELVDEETFEGPQLDTNRWTVYNGPGNGGVGLRRPEAISQSDGTLKITGRGDVSGGMNWNDGGRIYGRWEIRARNDAGTGYAPNILLWPTSGNWPAEGEVNIMEIPAGDRSSSLSVLHYGEDNAQYWHWEDGDFTQWHNFALEWLPDRVTVYIDGEEIVSWDDPDAIPFAPMHLAIQNDVGPHGGFIPARDETTPDEVSLEVDWVRIYAP